MKIGNELSLRKKMKIENAKGTLGSSRVRAVKLIPNFSVIQFG